MGVLVWWWWGPSGNAQSVLSHSGCHHLSLYFTVLWTWAGLELSASLWSVFGNISQHFIYNLWARPVPHCGRCLHREYAMTHAYHLTDFKRKGVNTVTNAAFSLFWHVEMMYMTFFKCMLDDPLHYWSFNDCIYRKAERSLGKHVTLSGGVFKSLGISATAFCYPAFSTIVKSNSLN